MMKNEQAPLIWIGSRVRKSPFFAATRRYGCKAYSIYNHMYIPLYYEDPVSDYWRLVKDVTLWDVGCQRQVEVTGPDARRFVQLLTPRNLSKCAAGQCKYVLLTTENGGIINDPVLLCFGDNHFWLSLADADILLWAQGLATNAGMNVSVTEPDVSPLQLQGPKSVSVMQAAFGDWVNDLRYYRFIQTELDDIPVVVSRTGWSGERGYEIFLRDSQYGDVLWERLMKAGEPYNIGPGAPSQIRRLEAGMLSYGADMTINENPYELGLARFIDLEQDADFIGKAALTKIKTEGVRRKLVGVEIEADPLPSNEEPWPVYYGADRTGKVTSCAHSPRLAKNIGFALVNAQHAEPGTALMVKTPTGMAEANVVTIPFLDPQKQIVKAK